MKGFYMPKIYTLGAPVDADGVSVEHLNIFRTDFEVRRDNATFHPKIDLYISACDATGTEVMRYDEQGKLVPVGSTFEKIKFEDTNQPIRDAYKALLQAIYEYLQSSGRLASGTIHDV